MVDFRCSTPVRKKKGPKNALMRERENLRHHEWKSGGNRHPKKNGKKIILCTKFFTTHFKIIEGPRVLKFKGV